MKEEEIHVRTDVSAVFERAAAAGVISLDEPWMYMYSIGPAHYFKHVITRRYRVWDEDQERSLS
jgi:hypothetical protein